MATETAKAFRREIDLGDGSGVQVFEGDTAEEVMDLMAEAQRNATKKIRQQAEENRTLRARAINAQDETPDPFYDPPQYTPRDLTPGERMQLARDAQDPAKAQEAWDRAFEARTGMKPAQFAERASEEELERAKAAVRAAANEFFREVPECAKTNSNAVALAGYMEAHRMTPASPKNWRIAFRALKAADALELRSGNGQPGGNGNGATPRDSATGGRAGDSNATPAAGTGGDSANDGWQARDRSSGLGNRSGAGTPRGEARQKFPSVEELRRLHADGKLAMMLQKDKKLAAYVDTLPAGSII